MLCAEIRYLVALLLLACSSNVFAEIVLVPPGLNPGDQYRLAFVTDGKRDATSSNIADYNIFVTSQAAMNPALSSIQSWTAIASTSSVDARDNTNTNPNLSIGVPIYTLQATPIANSNSDLWDGSIINPLIFDQFGATKGPFYFVWTGTNANGTKEVGLGGSIGGTQGAHNVTDNQWIAHFTQAAFLTDSLYAISPVLTAPVPEPSSAVLVGIGACGWSLARRHRTQNS